MNEYMDLFVHRTDVYAEQQANGAYMPVRQEFTENHMSEHLDGWASYGVYCIKPVENTVKFIVFDLDIMDADAELTLQELVQDVVLRAMGGDPDAFDALLWEFSGNKGHHAWVFLDKPMLAKDVRKWMAADFFPRWREAASTYGWPGDLEVFPKQDEVAEGGFGNLIKLPEGTHAVSGLPSEIVGCDRWAESVLDVVPLDTEFLREHIDGLPEPEEASHSSRRREGEKGPQSPFACVDFIMNEGAGAGYRDNAMFHLALYLYGHGIPESYAQAICADANDNFQPPMGKREVEGKVRSAYTGRYEGARCGTGWLTEICPGPCQGGWRVAQTEQNALAKADIGSAVEVEIMETRKAEGKTRVRVTHPDAENAATFVMKGNA